MKTHLIFISAVLSLLLLYSFNTYAQYEIKFYSNSEEIHIDSMDTDTFYLNSEDNQSNDSNIYRIFFSINKTSTVEKSDAFTLEITNTNNPQEIINSLKINISKEQKCFDGDFSLRLGDYIVILKNDVESFKLISKLYVYNEPDLSALLQDPMAIKPRVSHEGDIIPETNIIKSYPQNNPEEPYQHFEVEQPPIVLNFSAVRSTMIYPKMAKETGIEGNVTIKVMVGIEGRVEEVGKISGPEVFYEEVAKAVLRLEFQPAVHNGTTVRCWLSVPFNFSLRKEKKDNEEK